MNLARTVAQQSKDPSTKSGAVIVAPDRKLISVGYNGFARGVQDLPERYANRDQKMRLVVHCEVNAAIAAQRDLSGFTLYTWPWMTCSPCAAVMIQAGIREVVAPVNYSERWQADFDMAKLQYDEAGVTLRLLEFPTT